MHLPFPPHDWVVYITFQPILSSRILRVRDKGREVPSPEGHPRMVTGMTVTNAVIPVKCFL